MFFSAYTFGCKLNQLETEAITDSFCREGFTFVPWNAASFRFTKEAASEKLSVPSLSPHLMVINTCTVTSLAEQKARRLIRKLHREYPKMCLIITGCYAQVEEDVLASLDPASGTLFVLPGEKKNSLLDLARFLSDVEGESISQQVASWMQALSSNTEAPQTRGDFRFQPETFTSHSRAFLKIQDGCNYRCTFCRTVIARGKSRSIAAVDALEALKTLERNSFAEAVLTGVNISQYCDGDLNLTSLLEYFLSNTESIRIRLTSIDPNTFALGTSSGAKGERAAAIQLLKHPRIQSHFHISLQSGSDAVLKKMARWYTSSDIEEMVQVLRLAKDDPFLACDVIAGFPGETDADFQDTFSLCQRIGFAWIHAFPFSPRPGTAAASFPQRVSDRDTVHRMELLTNLAHKGRARYIERWIGKEVDAIVEQGEASSMGKGSKRGKGIPAVSENYLKLLVRTTNLKPESRSLIRCRILSGIINDPRFDALAEAIIIE